MAFRSRASLRGSRRTLGRSRRGVASAIATLFVILIVAMMFAQYITTTFPQEMQAAEFQHTLQVGDQFLQLQAAISSEVDHPSRKVILTTPVSLAGNGVAPLGPPAGSLVRGTPSAVDNASYQFGITSGSSSPPAWNTSNICPGAPPTWSSSCTFSTAGSSGGACGAAGLAFLNFNVSYRDLMSTPWSVTGTDDCVFLNISGSHDDIQLKVTGTTPYNVIVNLQGNFDDLLLSTSQASAYGDVVRIYGQNDVYNLTATGNGITVYTYFAGYSTSLAETCPYLSTSSTDGIGGTTSTGTNVNQFLIWQNLVGYSTPQTQTGMPGGVASDHMFWQNTSGQISCAFQSQIVNTYSEGQFGGLTDKLLNVYSPQVTYSFEEGAVIEEDGSGSTMLGGPQFAVLPVSGGYSLALTLVQLHPFNISSNAGTGVVGVQTWLISETTSSFSFTGSGSYQLSGAQQLVVTTPNSAAWVSWADGYPSVFPVAPTVSGCYTYQGIYNVCKVTISVVDVALSLTVATVGVRLTG